MPGAARGPGGRPFSAPIAIIRISPVHGFGQPIVIGFVGDIFEQRRQKTCARLLIDPLFRMLQKSNLDPDQRCQRFGFQSAYAVCQARGGFSFEPLAGLCSEMNFLGAFCFFLATNPLASRRTGP